MNDPKIAVLSNNRLYWHNQNSLTYADDPGPVYAENLCELGLKNHLHTIWVLPGSEQSSQVLNNPGSIMQYTSGEYDVRVKRNEQGIPTFGSVKRVKGTFEEKRLIYFGFPEHDPKWMIDSEEWALADIENATELLDVIRSTEAALSPRRIIKGQVEQEPFHLAWSPGYSGMALIKGMLKLYGHVGWLREADLSMLPACSEPGGFLWKRALTGNERTAKYIHFFDRNSQFPAACTGAELGEGSPIYATAFTEKLPGVWHVNVLPGFSNREELPPLPTGELWAYTPTVQAMKALGSVVTVYDGWVWTTHHRTLQEWAKHTWEARQELKRTYGKGSAQEHLTKMITNRGLGWLDLGVVRQEKRTDEPTHRPDWYNLIRSLARYRMVLKLLEMAKLGSYPIMIVADNIAYVSDDVNPETAIPGLMRRSSELGGFKSDGTYLLSEVLPFLDSLDPNAIRKQVKQLQKVGQDA